MRLLDLRTKFPTSFSSRFVRAAGATLCCLLLSICLSAQARPLPGCGTPGMQSKAGQVTFNIEFEQKDDGLHATLINATDRQPFSSAVFKDGVLTLRMDYYDGALTLHYTASDVIGGRVFAPDQQGYGSHPGGRLVPHHERAGGCAVDGLSLAGDWVLTWPEERAPRRRR